MKKFIPRFLKPPLIALYVFWKCLSRGGSAEGVRLNMAGVLPKGPRAIVHGGKVKLLALRERFGETWKRFTVAYFVSSGLPFAPAVWMRLYKLFGVRVVWNQNGVAYPAWAKGRTDAINALMEPIHHADYVVFQTAFTKRCSDLFLGPYEGPSEILINPVDTKRFAPRHTPLAEEPFVVIMSGHHFESKERLATSLGAIRKLHADGVDVKLLVIGNTQELPQEEWLDVRGTFTQAEAPELYREAHVLLHLKSLDPCPTVVLEALASGLPVVGLANGGMPELVEASSGILLEAEEDFDRFSYPSSEEVAAALLKARRELPTLRLGARERSLRFDKEKWLERHEEIFNTLLKK